MKEEIRSYIEQLFDSAPKTAKVNELKEELFSNVTARYDDLIAQGRSEEDAFKIAVGGIGDISELIRNLENDKIYNYAKIESDRRRSAMLISVAVGLYIIGVAVQIFFAEFSSAYIGTVIMFVIAAVATGLIVYNAMSRPKYRKADDTIVEEFKQWKHSSDEMKQMYRAVSSALWPLIVAIYFLVSFFTDSWPFSWIIFIIGAAVQNIIKLAFEMRGKN